MLTSSESKWRCMWHMLVWSVLLTLASQYLDIVDHIALYIFAFLCMVILPIFTAIYSNTSGRHGAGLIRVAYVVCDPVLACITITPVLVLNHLPKVVTQYNCLIKHDSWNLTCDCISNRSAFDPRFLYGSDKSAAEKELLVGQVLARFVAIQICVAVPILLSLLMGRRTVKMSSNTYIMTFAYWFVTAIELVDMIETIRLGDIYKDVIYTTETIISITMIITNSYAVVTLCSFISPRAGQGEKQFEKRFDLIYRIFVGVSAVLFTEIPLLVARFQMLTADTSRILPAAFYLWCIKDFLFICLIMFIILSQNLVKKGIIKIPCRVKFDNPDIIFQPEKRDEYISSKKTVTFQDPPATTFGEWEKPVGKTPKATEQVPKNTPDSSKKAPNSVLKNGSQTSPINSGLLLTTSRIDRNSTGQLTDLSSRKNAHHNSSMSVDTGRRISEQSTNLSLPLGGHSSAPCSLASSPRTAGGARPKIVPIHHQHANPEVINGTKSRPQDDFCSDTDSLV